MESYRNITKHVKFRKAEEIALRNCYKDALSYFQLKKLDEGLVNSRLQTCGSSPYC